MCYNCGCHIPQDNMGHPDNISESTLEALAKKRKISFKDIQQQLLDYLNQSKDLQKDSEYEPMFEKAAKAWGQSVDDAKKQTANLLKDEL